MRNRSPAFQRLGFGLPGCRSRNEVSCERGYRHQRSEYQRAGVPVVLASVQHSLGSSRIQLALQHGVEKGVGNLLPERPEACFAQKVPDPVSNPRRCRSNVARTTESPLFRSKITHSELRILRFLCCLPFQDEFHESAEHAAGSVVQLLRIGKGVRNLLPERPEGCFAQKVPDPFFNPRRCRSKVARTTESPLLAGKIPHSELRILCFLSCLLFQDGFHETAEHAAGSVVQLPRGQAR